MSHETEQLQRRYERERAIRHEAEVIAERATRVLYDRQRELQLLSEVASAANRAETVEAALSDTLDAVCAHTGWPVGHAWVLDEDEDEPLLTSTRLWHLPHRDAYAGFREQTEPRTFTVDEGMPGRVLGSGQPFWVPDIAADDIYPRAATARAEGLHAAVGCPVTAGTQVIGVLEFFTPEVQPPDPGLLEVLTVVASQAGRAMERVRAQEQLGQRAEALERSNAELETFAYIASHDLREPLRTVAGFVGLLARRYQGQLDSDADDFIAFALDGTARMQRLIDDLLLYSRAGRFELRSEPVDTGVLVEQTLRVLASSVEEVGGSIEVTGELPVVPGASSELERVFTNLIGNALKFHAPDSPPRAQISATRTEDGSAWRFAIVDNGIGIEARHRERVFKMFQRLHTQDAYEGTGIGLAVCERIIERHGGRIWVEEADGGGSAFYFELPVKPPRNR